MTDRQNSEDSAGAARLLRKLPARRYNPAISLNDLRKVLTVFEALPALEYPINSAGELIHKLGGPQASMEISGTAFRPAEIIKMMPAHYFPLASVENFVEKLAELIRTKGGGAKKATPPADSFAHDLAHIRAQLPALHFPIHDVHHLTQMLGTSRQYTFRNRVVDVRRLAEFIPASAFPFKSKQDFERKVMQMLRTGPGSAKM